MPSPVTARVPLRGKVASVFKGADAWHIVLYRPAGSAQAAGASAPGVVERAQSLPLADVSGLAAALARVKPAAIVRLVRSERVVVRTIAAPLPTGDVGQMRSALDLLGEAQLGGTFAPHRRAALALATSTEGSGLVAALGWSGEHGHDVLDDERFAKIAPQVFAPEPAALVALAAAAKSPWALSVDAAGGVVASCGLAGDKPALRVARDDPEDARAWSALLQSQARLVAGDASTPSALQHLARGGVALGEGAIFSPESQASTSGQWLADFGLALGAAICATSGTPGLHACCAMLPQPPVPYRPWVVQAAEGLAPAARSWPVLAACAALALLGPWGLTWARSSILKSHAEASGEDDSESILAQKQAEHYQYLKDRRWPMTKLLADLTANMPQGITLDSVAIEYGSPIRVSGSADSRAVVSEWRAALDKSLVFSEVRTPTADNARFELTANVARPFGANSVLVAKPTTGAGGSSAPAARPASSSPPSNRPAAGGNGGGGSGGGNAGDGNRNGRGNRGGGGGGGNGGGGGSQASTPAPKAPPMPAAISDAEIAAMDLPTATKEWANRKAAAGRPGVSETDKQRLTSEADKLQTRRKALQASGGGGQ